MVQLVRILPLLYCTQGMTYYSPPITSTCTYPCTLHPHIPSSSHPHTLTPSQVHLEYKDPHSQARVMGPKVQHMWSQSLYILCNLLESSLLNIGEIDPLNRRYSMLPRPDTLVQGE